MRIIEHPEECHIVNVSRNCCEGGDHIRRKAAWPSESQLVCSAAEADPRIFPAARSSPGHSSICGASGEWASTILAKPLVQFRWILLHDFLEGDHRGTSYIHHTWLHAVRVLSDHFIPQSGLGNVFTPSFSMFGLQGWDLEGRFWPFCGRLDDDL